MKNKYDFEVYILFITGSKIISYHIMFCKENAHAQLEKKN